MNWLFAMTLLFSPLALAANCPEFLEPRPKAEVLIEAMNMALDEQLVKPNQLAKLAEPIALSRYLKAQPNDYATFELKSFIENLIDSANAVELFEMSKELKKLSAKIAQQQNEVAVAHEETKSVLNPKLTTLKELNPLNRDFYFFYLDKNGAPYFISRMKASSFLAPGQTGSFGGGTPQAAGRIDINHLKEVSDMAAALRDPPLPYTLATLHGENTIFPGSEDLNDKPIVIEEADSIQVWATSDQKVAYLLDLKNPMAEPQKTALEDWQLKKDALAKSVTDTNEPWVIESNQDLSRYSDLLIYQSTDPQSRLKFSSKDYQIIPGSEQIVKNSDNDYFVTFLTANSKLYVCDLRSKGIAEFQLNLNDKTLFKGTSTYVTQDNRTVVYYLDRSGLYLAINLFD